MKQVEQVLYLIGKQKIIMQLATNLITTKKEHGHQLLIRLEEDSNNSGGDNLSDGQVQQNWKCSGPNYNKTEYLSTWWLDEVTALDKLQVFPICNFLQIQIAVDYDLLNLRCSKTSSRGTRKTKFLSQ